MIPQVDPVTVDLWLVATDTSDPDADARCLALLSPDERARHDRFVFEKDRRTYRIAHAMVRTVLGERLGVPPLALRFGVNPWGRPDVPQLSFNLSHTDGLAALAVSEETCGVDVEAIDRLDDPCALAESVFAPAEVRDLRALPEAERRERFFALWTLKEAYIKARGMGLALPLDGFAFDVPTNTVAFAPGFPEPDPRWAFVRRTVTARHRLAVCVRGTAPPQLAVHAFRPGARA